MTTTAAANFARAMTNVVEIRAHLEAGRFGHGSDADAAVRTLLSLVAPLEKLSAHPLTGELVADLRTLFRGADWDAKNDADAAVREAMRARAQTYALVLTLLTGAEPNL